MRAQFVLLAFPLALAQAQAPAAPGLAPVVVTATRVGAPVRVPATAAVLHGDSLRARGITQLADALRLVPGVAVVRTSSFGSQTSLFMRGGQGNFVRVLLDGVPLNEPGGAFDLSSVTLDNIDRVEVVRGPASVLYGADAVTGVVQLLSRHATRGLRGALALDGGSHGQRDVALSGSAGGRVTGLTLSLADRAADGILPFNNAYRNRTASAALRLTPDARTEATLSARWQASTYRYPTEFDGSIADRNAEVTNHRLALALSGRRTLAGWLSATWNLAAGQHDPRSNDGPDSVADSLGFFGFYSRGTVTRRTADVLLTARRGASQAVTLGAEVARDHERSSSRSLSEYGVDAGTFVAARNNGAVLLQFVGGLPGRVSYQVGARLDDNSAFGTFRTMRAAAAWDITPAWRLRGAAGSAFRAPSFFENFASGYVRGNAALAPERSRSRELAVEGAVGGAALSLVAYQQRFGDLIQYTAVTASPAAPNYVNVAGASADGIEAELSAPLPLRLLARAQYAFARTRVTDAGFDTGDGATFVRGAPLIRRPAHAARLELGRPLTARADLVVGAAYTGHSHDRNFAAWPAAPVVLRARTLVDVAAGVRLSPAGARLPLRARVRADNLTNVLYEGIYGFRAPGRVLRVGLTLGEP